MDWMGLKDEAARMLLEKDALHIYAALAIQVGTAMVTRRSLGHLLPWFFVLGLELLNELNDIRRGGEPQFMPWQLVSGVHDILNTMILPTVLLVLCRRAPSLFAWRQAQIDPDAGDEGAQRVPRYDDPGYGTRLDSDGDGVGCE